MAGPSPLREKPLDRSDALKGWRWAPVLEDPSLNDESFSHDEQSATLRVQVVTGGEAATFRGFVADALGFSFRVGNRLHRQIPHAHPTYPWLFCKRVSNVQGLGYRSRTQEEIDAGTFGATYPVYQRTNLTLHYGTLPFDVREDSEVHGYPFGGEWMRWVEKRASPLTEFGGSDGTSGERGQFRIDDPNRTNVTPIKSGATMHVAKTLIEWRWYCVPEDYLMATGPTLGSATTDAAGFPENIAKCVGRVNQLHFAGFPPGTLLMEGPQIQPATQIHPVFSRYIPPAIGSEDGTPAKRVPAPNINRVPRVYNVILSMKFFSPPTVDRTPSASNPEWQLRGWNLVPDGSNSNGYWFRARTADGRVRYEAEDFHSAFTAVKAGRAFRFNDNPPS